MIAVLADRRCQLFAATAALAIVLAFIAVPDRWAIPFVSHAGFWVVLVTFAIWVRALLRSFAADWAAWSWRRADWLSLGIVGLGTVVLLVHERFGFKIVMDEIMLLGTSMSMHLDKSVLTPLRGNDIQGAFMIVEGIVDKRPLFFPFLVSLLHDVSGYRPENAFVLNAALTAVFLWLVCVIGRLTAGRIGGWIGVALLAGLPLLAHNATGGGFELLNLVMIAATLLLGRRYVEKRDADSLSAFCYAGMLLSQVRYESVIYLLPVTLTVLWVWYREGRALWPWPILAAPLLMVHYPLHHRIFDLRASSWEMMSKPGYSEPFSAAYIPENLESALRFFFGRASDQPNSIVLSALGILAVPFFALLLAKRVRQLGAESPANVSVAFFSVGLALQFALMMCYFWGKFDDAVIRRLSLPTHLALVIAILSVLPQFSRPVVARVILVLAGGALLTRSVPSMAAHAYSQEYLPGRETAWRREFMAAQPRPDYLMIDNDATLWITHLVSATPTVVAVKRKNDLVFHLRNRTFSDMYVFQRLTVDPDTGKQTLREGDDLGPAFVLEPVTEQRLQLLTVSRISRVKEIRAGAESPTATGNSAPPRTPKNAVEIEKARQQFLESYMKQLP